MKRLWDTNARFYRHGLLLSVLALAAGCSSSSGVSGKVTYQEKIVPGGMVVFHGADNWTGNSPIDEDGSYTIAKVPPGKVTITVDTRTAPGAPMGGGGGQSPMEAFKNKGMPGGPPQMKPPANLPEAAKNSPIYNPKGQANRYVKIPAKYADKEKSGLTYEVTRGKQQHDIKLD